MAAKFPIGEFEMNPQSGVPRTVNFRQNRDGSWSSTNWHGGNDPQAESDEASGLPKWGEPYPPATQEDLPEGARKFCVDTLKVMVFIIAISIATVVFFKWTGLPLQ